MKKALLLMALFLGTSVMVNAQAAPAKEVKSSKHAKHHHHKSEMKDAKAGVTNEKK